MGDPALETNVANVTTRLLLTTTAAEDTMEIVATRLANVPVKAGSEAAMVLRPTIVTPTVCPATVVDIVFAGINSVTNESLPFAKFTASGCEKLE